MFTSRKLLVGLVGLALNVSLGILVVDFVTSSDAPLPFSPSKPARAESDTPAAPAVTFSMPTGPFPDHAPYVGPDGRTADGFPTRVVDLPEFVRALHAREFERLDGWLDEVLAAFVADPRTEYDYEDVAAAFARNAPGRRALVEAYALARPRSVHAAVVRAHALVSAAHEARGDAFAADTPPERFAAMRARLGPAREAIERAEALGVPTTAILAPMLRLARLAGDDALDARARRLGQARCPACMVWNRSRLMSLTERWGGGPGEAERAARALAAAHPENPRLRFFVEEMRLDALQSDDDSTSRAWDAARRRIPTELRSFRVLVDLARTEARARRHDSARAFAEQALALRPNEPDVHSALAFAVHREVPPDVLTRTVRFLAIVAPDERETTTHAGVLAEWIEYLAYQAATTGDLEGVRAAFARADAACITTAELTRARTTAFRLAEALGPLRAELAARPDDLDVVLRIDAAFARERIYEPIIPYWDAYLARHPNDARALRERSGTLFNVGRRAESDRDAEAACRLGDAVACNSLARRRHPPAPRAR